jgi:hypothetical protein
MAETLTLEAAARALREHFGGRVAGRRNEGRELMADALKDEFGISPAEAKTIVEALERAHTIRWVEGAVGPGPIPRGAAQAGRQTSTGNIAVPYEDGYWQL